MSMRLPNTSNKLMLRKYCNKRVWLVLNTYPIGPSTDQYGAMKKYMCLQLAIICKRTGLWWMLRLSIVKQNEWPGQSIASWSLILSMNVYILNKCVPPSSCGQSLFPFHVVVLTGTDCHHEIDLPLLVISPFNFKVTMVPKNRTFLMTDCPYGSYLLC